MELEALDVLLGDLMPLLKESANLLDGKEREDFEESLHAWNTRLQEQGPPNEEDEESGDEVVVKVVREMVQWVVDFCM